MFEVDLKCAVSYVSIPVIDKRHLSQHGKKPRRARSARFGIGKKNQKQKKVRISKKSVKEQKVIYVQWPILKPHVVFKNIVEAKAWGLVQHPNWNWTEFWDRVFQEDFGKGHPVSLFEEQAKAKSVAISFHGDEGVSKRQRNILILSWSSLAIHGPSELTKFPFAVSQLGFHMQRFQCERQTFDVVFLVMRQHLFQLSGDEK